MLADRVGFQVRFLDSNFHGRLVSLDIRPRRSSSPLSMVVEYPTVSGILFHNPSSACRQANLDMAQLQIDPVAQQTLLQRTSLNGFTHLFYQRGDGQWAPLGQLLPECVRAGTVSLWDYAAWLSCGNQPSPKVRVPKDFRELLSRGEEWEEMVNATLEQLLPARRPNKSCTI